ncbi:MAG: AmmeMemoRadiSam system radical SAM enzyme [candidate division WOR-3 bacterium]
MVEARYYKTLNGKVECLLCPHHCKIEPGKTGVCRVRMNKDRKLWATAYGQTTSIAIDPIEKKPLYHFFPGSQILSIAPNGCNMRCPFCQNWEISQEEVSTRSITFEEILHLCQKYRLIGVSYTYTEPLIWFEFLMDVGRKVHEAGLKNVLVTNGMIEEEPLNELLPVIDAMNIDLKSIRAETYRKILHGDLEAVQRTIELSRSRCLVEITNLIVTGLNDAQDEIVELIDYVASLGRNTVLHFSRYFPNWKFDAPMTPDKVLNFAYNEAVKKLDFVYLGNIAADYGANTCCPECKSILIERVFYHTKIKGIKNGVCQNCNTRLNIIM